MVSDYQYHPFESVRHYSSYALYPIQWVADAPIKLTNFIRQHILTHQQLVQENESLRKEQFIQRARSLTFFALETENDRLRTLLQSSPRKGGTLWVAEIVQVDPDPFMQRIILDKGSEQGVKLGQPVMDAEGVMGEVIEVNPSSSRVILLTDASHGISVENVRNGVRGIAMGTGSIKNLVLQHLPNPVDLKVGDTLVTSGLDGRYPAGYPVGTVSEVKNDPGESFMTVKVIPSAHLARSRQVLLFQPSVTSGEGS